MDFFGDKTYFFKVYASCRYTYFQSSAFMKGTQQNFADPKFQLPPATMPITRAQVPRSPAAQLRANMPLGPLRATCHFGGLFVLHQHSTLW